MRKIVVLIVVVGVVVGAAALVFTSRPALADARDETEQSWKPLMAPLTARYAQLEPLAAQLEGVAAATGTENPEVSRLSATMRRWSETIDGDSAVRQVEAANDLEAAVGRVRMVVAGSARLRQAVEIQETFTAFAAEAPSPDDVAAYNDSVRRYQRTREEALRRPVARLFGFGPIPTLELTPTT